MLRHIQEEAATNESADATGEDARWASDGLFADVTDSVDDRLVDDLAEGPIGS